MHRFLYSAVVGLVNDKKRRALWKQSRYAKVSDDSDGGNYPTGHSMGRSVAGLHHQGYYSHKVNSEAKEIFTERNEANKKIPKRSKLDLKDRDNILDMEDFSEEVNEVTTHKSVVLKRRFMRFGENDSNSPSRQSQARRIDRKQPQRNQSTGHVYRGALPAPTAIGSQPRYPHQNEQPTLRELATSLP